jgi:hypothetical protein
MMEKLDSHTRHHTRYHAGPTARCCMLRVPRVGVVRKGALMGATFTSSQLSVRRMSSLNTGLLGRPWRPSVARTARSLERLIGGLRPRCSDERRPPSKT